MIGVAYALAAALSYGASQVLTRQGVSDLAPPLTGSFIALLWGTVGFSLLSARGLADRPPDFWRGAKFFAAGGIFSAAGVLLMFEALSRGQVVVVSPVLATNPLFTLFLATVMLRGLEQITLRVIAGTCLVVLGVVVLTVA
jgi:drug/metabolite transporter (DMT)-like permease